MDSRVPAQQPRCSDRSRSRLQVRDLVLAALLAAVGGVLSTYIGYIGNLINRLFGVPFGAGQLIAGLHIIWPLLARALTRRFGSGTLTGAAKGLVEFLSGGTHGVVIVAVSLIEGLIVDVGMSLTRRPRLSVMMIVGGLASASNVFLFQALYFSGISLGFIWFMAGLAAISGAILGGMLAWDLLRILRDSNLVAGGRTASVEEESASMSAKPRRRVWIRNGATVMALLGLLAGAVYYYTAVYDPFASAGTLRISGAVAETIDFRYQDWIDAEVTITTEMRGSISYIPPQPYTGVPVARVFEEVVLDEQATDVVIVGSDGYQTTFDLRTLQARDDVILVLDDGALNLVAAGFDGSYWVKQVSRIVVR
ncbi:ECF transporter S component [Candidatus Bipolaricaulota bacterium]|nr:ECF transporter S component [Candidatus Bipolaricaulota bacterium]